MRHRQIRRARWTLGLALCLGALALPACDFLGSGGETTVEGVVVDAVTGEPLEAIWVTLRVSGGRFGAYPAVARDATDSRGRFYLHDAVERTSYPLLYANRVMYGEDLSYGAVYNPRYHTFMETVESGRRHTVRIELRPLGE